jgi:hypothetical protein
LQRFNEGSRILVRGISFFFNRFKKEIFGTFLANNPNVVASIK